MLVEVNEVTNAKVLVVAKITPTGAILIIPLPVVLICIYTYVYIMYIETERQMEIMQNE